MKNAKDRDSRNARIAFLKFGLGKSIRMLAKGFQEFESLHQHWSDITIGSGTTRKVAE